MLFNFPSNIKDISALDEDMCTLLGYYVSDGNTPSRNRTIFYFNLTEQEYISEIEDILKRKGFDYKIFKRNTENVICIQINNSQIVSILNKYGGKPSNKIFSKEIIFLPPKKQEKIINAYISGDGWILNQNEKWKPQYFISTSIEQLAYQLQLMIARTGYFAPIHKREPREFICRGKCYKNSGEINLIFRKNTKYSRIKYNKKNSAFLIPITSIREIDYTGKIYDLSLVYSPNIYKVKGISIHNCASAIASTSMLSVMITEKGGMHIEEAIKITPQDILKKLGGLPPRKIHCSVLGDQALRAAIDDYSKKN